jgi:hypothetical protein
MTSADGRVYQVGGKSFVFFRTPRADAVDPDTGERYDDVIVLWVAGEGEKQALVQDPASRQEVVELVQDAWLAQASATRRRRWLEEHGLA